MESEEHEHDADKKITFEKDADQERWERENRELGFDTDPDDNYGEARFIKAPKPEHKWELDDMLDEHEADDMDMDMAGALHHLKATKAIPDRPEIDISTLQITSGDEAQRIAEQVILVLEEDVVDYFEKIGVAPEDIDSVGPNDVREKISGDSLSIASEPSLVLPDEPSTLRLFYEKGTNRSREEEIPHLHGVGVDETCEAVLHRTRKYKKHGKPKMVDGFSQTRAMSFVPEDKAAVVFLTIYPQPDDYKAPGEPERKQSMIIAINKAEQENPHVDREILKGPQIKVFSNRKKILPPLRGDYYKEETFWTGSKFKGEFRNRQFYKGHYDHPTGVTYESEWKDGHFHSTKHHGIVEYPRGDTFEGEWENGRYISGEITFADGLKYTGDKEWHYCDTSDRRLRAERYFGMRPAGDTIFNDQYPMAKLPPGCYDIGDAIYNPKNGEVRGYDGFYMRLASEKEHMWIVSTCRKQLTLEEEYIPTFNPDRLPGNYMEQTQKFTLLKRNYH